MLCLKSPAKINLFLKLIKKREDGYHELASLFHTISLFDEISFELHYKDEFLSSESILPLDENNLIIKALLLFRKKTQNFFPLRIHLNKIIPMQAGLGGGSSNAATTLWALNFLLNHPLSHLELLHLASELGSDVPFFLSHGCAFCTGRGEIVQDIEPLKDEEKFWIIMPPKKLATANVFRQVEIEKIKKRDPFLDLNHFLIGKKEYYNDLEEAAFICLPELYFFKKYLYEIGFHTVLLSGSGSAFFCLGDGKIEKLPQNIWKHSVNFIYRNKNRWFNNT